MSASVTGVSPVPRLGEEIAAEEGVRPGLEQVAAFPGVRQMRRVDPADRVGAEPERLAVGQDAGRPVEGVAVDHPVDATTQRLGGRRGREQEIQRAAFVVLEVRERDVAEALDRHHRGDRLAHQRGHPAGPRVEEQRRVVHHQVLVERKAAGELGRRRAEPIDAARDLVDTGVRSGVRDHARARRKASRSRSPGDWPYSVNATAASPRNWVPWLTT